MMGPRFSEQMLTALREYIKKEISPDRASHILAVEQTACELAQIYCPERVDTVRAAALLHDVTKELSIEEHIVILTRFNIDKDEYAPATMHAMTASLVIPERFPEFYDDEIVGAVRYHTTGKPDMTLIEKIIYLADYIEPTRKFEGCRRLRAAFFGVDIDRMSQSERERHLDEVILKSLEQTLGYLSENGGKISPDTQSALEYLVQKLNDKR